MSTPAADQLGASQGEYRIRRKAWVGGIIICVFFAAIGIPGLILLLLPNLSEGGLDTPSKITIAFGTVLCLGLGAWILWATLGLRGVRLQIFENGLAYSRKGKTQIFRWDEIDRFFSELTQVSVNMIPAGTRQKYTVQKADGEKIVFTNDLNGVEEVADRVSEETFRRMMPRAVDALNSGGQVSFGKISATQKGLSNNSKHLAWSEMKEVKVELGVIKIEQKNAKSVWAKIAYSATPNAHVFFALADRMSKVRN